MHDIGEGFNQMKKIKYSMSDCRLKHLNRKGKLAIRKIVLLQF